MSTSPVVTPLPICTPESFQHYYQRVDNGSNAMSTYTFESEYEIGPFGECLTKVEFCYYPSADGDDDEVEIQSASFYDLYFGRWRDLGPEASSNIDPDLDDCLLEYARTKYESDLEGNRADRAYKDAQEAAVSDWPIPAERMGI